MDKAGVYSITEVRAALLADDGDLEDVVVADLGRALGYLSPDETVLVFGWALGASVADVSRQVYGVVSARRTETAMVAARKRLLALMNGAV